MAESNQRKKGRLRARVFGSTSGGCLQLNRTLWVLGVFVMA